MAAPVPTGSFARIIMNGRIFGEHTVNEFVYWSIETPAAPQPAANAAVSWYNDVWVAGLKARLSSQFILESVYARTGAIGSAVGHQEFTMFANEAGGNTLTEALPSFVTVRAQKVPDNTRVFSSDPLAPDFTRTYYKSGITGIAEGDTLNGQLEPATAQALWDAAVGKLVLITIGVVPYKLMIVRAPNTLVGGNPAAWVEVLNVTAGSLLGSQVSRKP